VTNMEKTKITCHAELLERIRCLKLAKIDQEEDIKSLFKDLAFNFDLTSMMNGSTSGFAEKGNVLFRLVKVGLKRTSGFLIDQILGKHRSFNGFLRSLLADEISVLLINCNISKIIFIVNRFLFSNILNRTT